jgi:hypothetical protein
MKSDSLNPKKPFKSLHTPKYMENLKLSNDMRYPMKLPVNLGISLMNAQLWGRLQMANKSFLC